MEDEDGNDADEVDSDDSNETTGAAADEEENDDEDEGLDGEDEQHSEEQEKELLRHISASKGGVKKVQFNEFPSNKTFKRYKQKYGWHERKLEVIAAVPSATAVCDD